MGTCIKMEVLKGDKTTKEQFNKLYSILFEMYQDVELDDDIITIFSIYCPYSCADLDSQIKEELRKEFKGSDIIINLWYEERDPDESITL